MANKEEPSGDYNVGCGKPPKEQQFQPGQSGNPRGRPKAKKSGMTGFSELLNEPVKVTAGGKVREMRPFEASFRTIAKRSIDGHLPSIIKFLKVCEEYKALVPPPTIEGGGVIRAPRGVNFYEWLDSVTELVPVNEEQTVTR